MKTTTLLLGILCISAFAVATPGPKDNDAVLLNGVDQQNSHRFPRSKVKSCNVDSLQLVCTKNLSWTPGNSVSVHNNIAYFTDWNGYVYAMDFTAPGCPYLWSNFIPAQTGRYGVQTLYGSTGSCSRNTPTLFPKLGVFVLGDLSSARVWGFNMTNGLLLWETTINTYAFARITAEPSVSSDELAVHIGVSSLEEGDPSCFATYPPACVFRGSLLQLDARTGAINWIFNTSVGSNLDPYGYAGAPIWGSTFPTKNGKVCFATGNSYRVPDTVTACLNNNGTRAQCVDPQHLANSVVCVNENTGAKEWSVSFDIDVWTIACGPDGAPPGIFPLPTCDLNNNDGDIDFGQAPMIVPIHKKGKKIDGLIVGQKSGHVHAFNMNTGEKLYSVFTGPTSTVGGILFGHAYDGKNVYFSNVNGYKNLTTLVDGTNCTGGIVTAMEPNTGVILWQWCEPNGNRTYGDLSVSGDLIWTGSLNYAPRGNNLFAIRKSGELVYSLSLPGSQYAAPTFYKNYMLVATGYAASAANLQGTTMYVYNLAGDSECEYNDD